MDITERYRNAEKLLTPYTRESVLNGAPNVKWVGDEVFKIDIESYDENEKIVKTPVYMDVDGDKTEFAETVIKDRYTLSSDKGNIILTDTQTGKTIPLTDDAEPYYEYANYIDLNSQVTVKLQGYEEKPIVCWSPDRTKFVTYRSDRRKTPHLYVIKSYFDDDCCSRPELYSYPCPIPRDSDDVVPHYSFFIGDCVKGTMTKIDVPDLLYPPHCSDASSMFKWLDDSEHLYFTWLKRGYLEGRYYLIDANDGSAQLLFCEKAETFLNLGASGVPDGFGRYRFSNFVTQDMTKFFWWSEKDNYAHLYRCDVGINELVDIIPEKELIVQKLQYVDEENEKIYFMGNNDKDCYDPLYFNLYVVSFDGKYFKRLTPEDACHSVKVGKKAFVDTYSTVDAVPVTVLRDLEGNLIKEIVRADATKLFERGYVLPERFTVKASDGKTDIYGIIVKPQNPETEKVPLVDYIYGGAQMTNVPRTFTWDNSNNREIMGGLQQIARLGMAGVIIDGIGTPGRGKAFHDASWQCFEQTDGLADHVYCFDELCEKYPFIDKDKIGIWGNSGGGYGTVQALLTYPETYKVGVASSGNYDNRMYETGWTERYSGPFDEDVFKRGDAAKNAKNLTGKLLLAYGALDDNVSASETIRLCDILNRLNKDYDLMVCPRINHNVPSDYYFMRRKMDYFVKYLLGTEPPKEYRFELMK